MGPHNPNDVILHRNLLNKHSVLRASPLKPDFNFALGRNECVMMDISLFLNLHDILSI